MADELADLKNVIATLEAKLDGTDLASFKIKIEFSLLQIDTALKVLKGIQSSNKDNHNKYLLYKQLEMACNDIQKGVALDSTDHPQVKALSQSAEFQALEQIKTVVINQQQEWYPHYLAEGVQTMLSKDDKSIAKNLCIVIDSIAKNRQLGGKDKTEQIAHAIMTFSKSNNIPLFDKYSSIKHELKKWFEIEQQANITRLFPSPSLSKTSSNQ